MKPVRLLTMIGTAGAAAAMLAACSSGAASTSTGTTTTNAAAPATSSASASTAADLSTTTSSLGSIVVDNKGRTVYLFTNDTNNPSKSNCSGGCASVWPPVPAPASGQPTLSGVDSSKVGEVTRDDGSKQLTLNGWPLYEYQGDSATGDVKGEGVQGSWFAVSPDGTKVAGTAASSGSAGSTASSGGGSGYSSGGW